MMVFLQLNLYERIVIYKVENTNKIHFCFWRFCNFISTLNGLCWKWYCFEPQPPTAQTKFALSTHIIGCFPSNWTYPPRINLSSSLKTSSRCQRQTGAMNSLTKLRLRAKAAPAVCQHLAAPSETCARDGGSLSRWNHIRRTGGGLQKSQTLLIAMLKHVFISVFSKTTCEEVNRACQTYRASQLSVLMDRCHLRFALGLFESDLSLAEEISRLKLF